MLLVRSILRPRLGSFFVDWSIRMLTFPVLNRDPHLKVFLDSERFLLQELYDFLETIVPLSEVSAGPQGDPGGAKDSSSFSEAHGEEVAARDGTS